MFDHLYALADGKTIYSGTISNLIPHLAGLDLICPQYHNPADFRKCQVVAVRHFRRTLTMFQNRSLVNQMCEMIHPSLLRKTHNFVLVGCCLVTYADPVLINGLALGNLNDNVNIFQH